MASPVLSGNIHQNTVMPLTYPEARLELPRIEGR